MNAKRRRPANRMPSSWQGIRWALLPQYAKGISQARLLANTVWGTLRHGKWLQRWMAVGMEMHSRGLIRDLPGEYLRAARPSVHRGVGVRERVNDMIDHLDWLETALSPAAFDQLMDGHPVVLVDLPPPGGHDALQVQLRRAPVHAAEGDLLITLTLKPAPGATGSAQPVDVASLACSRLRLQGAGCLAIGGTRGLRGARSALSPDDMRRMLYGWRPPVFLVRVAQELARYWGLHLVGLDPAWHRLTRWDYRWRERHRQRAERIRDNLSALWEHFGASRGPEGWLVLPLNSDEGLSATDASSERRTRQALRADYWIRTSRSLRENFRLALRRPTRAPEESRVTQQMSIAGFLHSEDMVPSRVLDSGPGELN